MKRFEDIPKIREMLVITYKSDVIFWHKSSSLKSTAYAELKRVSNMINLFPKANVDVEVRLDVSGLMIHNRGLQESRGKAVKDALLRQGIDVGRIRTNICGPYGTQSPEDTVSFTVIDRPTGHLPCAPFCYQNEWQYNHQAC